MKTIAPDLRKNPNGVYNFLKGRRKCGAGGRNSSPDHYTLRVKYNTISIFSLTCRILLVFKHFSYISGFAVYFYHISHRSIAHSLPYIRQVR